MCHNSILGLSYLSIGWSYTPAKESPIRVPRLELESRVSSYKFPFCRPTSRITCFPQCIADRISLLLTSLQKLSISCKIERLSLSGPWSGFPASCLSCAHEPRPPFLLLLHKFSFHSFSALQRFLLPEKLFSTLSPPRSVIQTSLTLFSLPSNNCFLGSSYICYWHTYCRSACLYLAPKLDLENWNGVLRIPSAGRHSTSNIKSAVGDL